MSEAADLAETFGQGVERFAGEWMREILGIPQPPVEQRRYFSEEFARMDALPNSLHGEPNPQCDDTYAGMCDGPVVCVSRGNETLTIRELQTGKVHLYKFADVSNVFHDMQPGDVRYYETEWSAEIITEPFGYPDKRGAITLKQRLDNRR